MKKKNILDGIKVSNDWRVHIETDPSYSFRRKEGDMKQVVGLLCTVEG